MAEREAGIGWIPATQECMVAEDVVGGHATRTCGVIREHPHTQPASEEGAVLDVTEGLLEARDRGSPQPMAYTLHLEALEKGEKNERNGKARQGLGPGLKMQRSTAPPKQTGTHARFARPCERISWDV